MKKWINIKMDTWRNGCLEKIDDLQVHTKPLSSQIGCFSKHYSSNHPVYKMASAAFKYIPQTAATTFAFSSVCSFFYALTVNLKGSESRGIVILRFRILRIFNQILLFCADNIWIPPPEQFKICNTN